MVNSKMKERKEVLILDLRLADRVRPNLPRPSRYYMQSLQEDREGKRFFRILQHWIIRFTKAYHKP